MPHDLSKQKLFRKVFGSAILRVRISDMPGMLYSVPYAIEGNEVRDTNVLNCAALTDYMFRGALRVSKRRNRDPDQNR